MVVSGEPQFWQIFVPFILFYVVSNRLVIDGTTGVIATCQVEMWRSLGYWAIYSLFALFHGQWLNFHPISQHVCQETDLKSNLAYQVKVPLHPLKLDAVSRIKVELRTRVLVTLVQFWIVDKDLICQRSGIRHCEVIIALLWYEPFQLASGYADVIEPSIQALEL